jgi:CheY-like chemotaxis protein
MTENVTPGKAHILLVEDMKLNRDLAVILLEREGYRVTATDNALDALQSMATSSFDGVLLDIRMPGIDGLTAVDIIRTCERGQVTAEELPRDLADLLVAQLRGVTTPIIVMTASNAEQEKVRGLAAGADAFLAKPFTPEKLLFAVERIVKKDLNLE